MEIAYAMVIGVLISILIFGLKTGAGCGFSSIGKKNILLIGGSYFILSLILGAFAGHLETDGLEDLSRMGMAIHSVLAILLIVTGIYTNKKWNCRPAMCQSILLCFYHFRALFVFQLSYLHACFLSQPLRSADYG